MKRAIVLLPKFDNIDSIQHIREKYDPLASHIAPHITIVFPFESELSTVDLQSHLDSVLIGTKKFSIQMKDITGDIREGYLFLNVKRGNDQIIELHDRLYSGILANFLCREVQYCPHLTVGRVQEQADFEKAVNELRCLNEEFEIVIDKIYVENIDIIESSKIESTFDLE